MLYFLNFFLKEKKTKMKISFFIFNFFITKTSREKSKR